MQELQTEKLQPIKLPQLPDSPLVSVIIANYNYDRYINETLESVLNQTYQNFEIIVCDDGSTDNSCDVIAKYVHHDSRIKLISKQNGGVASALNAAYQKSKGQIICLLDADDLWMDRKLEKVVEAFKSDPQYGFVIHNVMQIDGQGNLLRPTPMFKKLSSGWVALETLENGGLPPAGVPPASALSVRREVAELIFPLNETFRRNADSLVSFLAPFVTVIESISEALSKFRFHGGNTTSQVSLTVDSLERGQSVGEAIHREQKQFLRRIYGEVVAEKLKSVSFNLLYCHDVYLMSRLKGLPKAQTKELHRQLVNHPQFCTFSSLHQKLLLQWGEYLPDILFSPVFKVVYGSGRLKRWARKLLARRLTAHYAQG
jgi:glycosyltransferase involved in cell wall biosynthesis